MSSLEGPRFHYHQARTLPHLLSLFHYTPSSFPPTGTSLIIIDNASDLLHIPPRNGKTRPRRNHPPLSIIVKSTFISSAKKLASASNTAILLSSQMNTKIQPGLSAQLIPAMMGPDWDEGVTTRIVFFRDLARIPVQSYRTRSALSLAQSGRMALRPTRYAGIIRARGVVGGDDSVLRAIVPFAISTVSIWLFLLSARANIHRFRGKCTNPTYPRSRMGSLSMSIVLQQLRQLRHRRRKSHRQWSLRQ